VILKGGEIALEYGMQSGPGRRREGYSTTKSIVATLVGAALHAGAIGSLDVCCDFYVPLRGSACEGVTVRNLICFCSEWPGTRMATAGKPGAWSWPRRAGSQAAISPEACRAQPQ
jgi:hypothetical protein